MIEKSEEKDGIILKLAIFVVSLQADMGKTC